jgi:hypothetical protein
MTLQQSLKTTGSIAAVASVLLVAMWMSSPRGRGQDQDDNGKDEEAKIEQGFKIAPVRLNLAQIRFCRKCETERRSRPSDPCLHGRSKSPGNATY